MSFSPYVPGEQPRIANLVKLNTNDAVRPFVRSGGSDASRSAGHSAALSRS